MPKKYSYITEKKILSYNYYRYSFVDCTYDSIEFINNLN